MLRARLLLPFVAALAAVALPTSAAAQDATVQDDPTCDAAVYRCPDMVARTPAQLRIARTSSGRRILYATNRLDNIGSGPLEVRGRRASTSRRSMTATQIVRRRGSGPVLRHAAGSIVFKPIPGQGAYWKFSQALRFELRRPGSRARTKLVRTGPKVVYCLRDLLRQPTSEPGRPRNRVFPACNQNPRQLGVTMGVSLRWRESYPAGYHEQYVDVTNLRGCFNLWHVADPYGRLVESDETNNANSVRVRLPARVGSRPRTC